MSAIRLYAAALAAGVLLTAVPASAQYYKPRPVSNPATGETYHIELEAGLWFPTADLTLASGGSGALSGIAGTTIDFKNDLGLTDQKFPEFKLVLRPTRKNKLRVEFIPISYTQSSTITRTIVFNGQRYNIGLPVNSSLDWKAWRFGYEFDFISRDRGFAGFLLDFKYTDVTARLQTPIINEFTNARAPIPTIGGIARVYVVPNISITGEVSGATLNWVPQSVRKDDTGHYVDFDVYGTVNFNDHLGAKVGYRSLDIAFDVRPDAGTQTLKGLYFAGVVRY